MTVDEAIDGLRRDASAWRKGGQDSLAEWFDAVIDCVESLQAENARLSQAAEPEAVAPKDLPDANGIWSRNGRTFLVGLGDEGKQRAVFSYDGGFVDAYSNGLPEGNWLPCTVLVPQAKEPEAKPERPPMLLAKAGDTWNWYQPFDSGWSLVNAGGWWGCHAITDVDESASDPEAVAIWKRERAE